MEMKSCIQLPIEDDEFLQELIEKGKDWMLIHGIGMRSKENFSKDSITFAPFLLFPSSFPTQEFHKAKRIQVILNELMHKVAHDEEFMLKALSETINADPFTAHLVQIHQEVFTEGLAQKVSMGLFRSDYMLDSISNVIKQVEVNTIASSFGALTSILPLWHKQALSLMGSKDKSQNIPDSGTLTGYANAFIKAHSLYCSKSDESKSSILFVIEDRSHNISDQRLLEFEIQKKAPHIRIIRRTLTEIGHQLQLGNRRRLYISDKEISVVYYRAGYVPAFYHSEVEWHARLQIERSRAIKCPSIQYHLAGSKKIQQELTRPNVLERFLKDPEQVQQVRDTFTGLYSLDLRDSDADKIIEKAINSPSGFVLKPQREGGGNNVYENEIPAYLKQILKSEERNAWILMDLIKPPPSFNYIIRPDQDEPSFVQVVNELGIFGAIIGDPQNIHMNEEVGHMIRSKANTSKEGGIAIGLGALDSVYLTE